MVTDKKTNKFHGSRTADKIDFTGSITGKERRGERICQQQNTDANEKSVKNKWPMGGTNYEQKSRRQANVLLLALYPAFRPLLTVALIQPTVAQRH